MADTTNDLARARAKAHAIAQPNWRYTLQPTYIDRRHHTRTRPLELLCLGRERTGTFSLRAALLQLGYYDVYHMGSALGENPPDVQLWNEALEAKLNNCKEGKGGFGREQWDALLGHCAAVTDQPCALFCKELMAAYSHAKVVLTVRDTPQAWYASVRDTILAMIALTNPYHLRHPGWNPLNHIQRFFAPDMFSGDGQTRAFFDKTHEALDADTLSSPEKGVEAYLAHNEKVRRLVREQDREAAFLEFNVKEGWEPLCRFLDKSVPVDEEGNVVPFPRINESADQREMIKQLRWIVPLRYATNIVKYLGPPALAMSASWWWWKVRSR